MEIIPLAESAAVVAGRIAGELERLGRPIGLADSMMRRLPCITASNW
jgi:predicted nucleic acid-binding protein